MIRRADASDISRLAALYHAVWHETQAPFMPQAEIARRSLEFFLERMTGLLQSTLVAEQNGALVAFAAWKGQLFGQLFVDAPRRGTCIASSLLRASEIEMVKEGAAEAELHCVIGNERARRFYERMGWHHRGRIMVQVAGEPETAEVPFWRMTKVLAA
jgi:GNAT superfamily N-acetyltransferase